MQYTRADHPAVSAGFGLVAASLVVLASGCGHPASAVQKSEAPAAVEVTTVRPDHRTLRQTIEQPGYLEPFEATPLYVKIAGYVKKVHADIGDAVNEGDVLAELSIPEMDRELKQKQALVRHAESEVAQAAEAVKVGEAAVAVARAGICEAEAGRTRAMANYERYLLESRRIQGLVQGKVLDEQTRDETLRQFKAAEAARDEVEAKVQSAHAALQESQARVSKLRVDAQTAQARLDVTRADHERMLTLLGYTKIRAPFKGRVTRRYVNTGDFLQPPTGSGAQKTEPLFVVVRADPVRVFVAVPEADAAWVRTGAPARVELQGLQGRTVQGSVTRTAWSLSHQERTLRTEIDLPNHDGAFRPGMYAQASITVEHPSVLTLPTAAVLTVDGQSFCCFVEDGKANRTLIKVGAREGDRIQVMKRLRQPAARGSEAVWEDFTGAEVVVASNPRALAPGQPVVVASSN